MGKRRSVLVIKPGNLGSGGVSTYLFSTVLPLAKSGKYDISFALTGSILDDSRARAFSSHGINLLAGEIRGNSAIGRYCQTKDFLLRVLGESRFDVIDINTGILWFQQLCLREAARAKVPTRIAHTHSITRASSLHSRIIFPLIRTSIRRDATSIVACSNDAGRFMVGDSEWGRRGILARNGINLDRFVSPTRPSDVVMPNDGGLLIVHVGNFVPEKNHRFLLDVFKKVLHLNSESRLWLVGDGRLAKDMQAYAEELGIAKETSFLGTRDDVPGLLAMADVFVFPSTSEGLGIAVIEAQASGLPCIVSDAVPNDASIPGCSIVSLPLEAPEDVWAREIVRAAGMRMSDRLECVRRAGYDIQDSSIVIGRLWDAETH